MDCIHQFLTDLDAMPQMLPPYHAVAASRDFETRSNHLTKMIEINCN